MIIVPVTGKISRHNLPLITIGLILINCLVFFAFQLNDERRSHEAFTFYFTSGLSEIEMSRFIEYRNAASEGNSGPQDLEKLGDEELWNLYLSMNGDTDFIEKLRGDQIITPQDAEYPAWSRLRNEYEYLESKITSANYGLIPVQAKPLTFFTYMFLHGGFQHLLGNMVFLWLVGCMIEMGSGRFFCGVTYVLTGLGAAALYWLMNPNSSIYLVGASGSIAGLMGAFCVLYGRKKVKFFYSLGFYFNYFRAPAIIILPVWIAKEIYFLYTDDISNVAYEAHLGGLISGAMLGLMGYILFRNTHADIRQADEQADDISPLIEKALARVSQLDMEAGSQLLEQVLTKNPGHIGAMTHLFNIHKNSPQDPRFHEIARRLIDRLTIDSTQYRTAGQIFEEYTRIAGRPCLSADLYLRMIAVLSGLGHPEKAERIMAMFLKQKPDLPGIPQALLKLADGYRQKGTKQKYQRCLILLGKKYPESSEGQIARRQLQNPPQAPGAAA
jgi:membrane associated rhomboid family serine protease